MNEKVPLESDNRGTPGKLIFVYNAGSGKAHGFLDSLHKVLSPSTYPCRLCELTYGLFGQKQEWKEFLKRLNRPVEFLHKNEIPEKGPSLLPQRIELPCVLIENGKRREILISADEFRGMEELADLMNDIEKKFVLRNSSGIKR